MGIEGVYPASFSRMQTFEQCELKYDFLYVSRTVKDEGNQYTDYGTRVHTALEKYALEGVELPQELRRFKRLVDRVVRAPGEKLFEERLAVNRSHEPVAWDDPDCYLRGIVDVLVVGQDKAYALDWKTGKPRDDDRQLRLMALLVFAHYPEVQRVDTLYVWLHHDQVTPGQYRRTESASMWQSFQARLVKMEEAVKLGVFKARPSPLCNWCAAKDKCSYARR